MINFAIRNLPARIASHWNNYTVTAEARIIESLPKIARLTYIQNITVSISQQVHACGFLCVNREATESPCPLFQELLVVFVPVQFLRVELYCAALFVSLRNERLNELETVSKKYNLIMRFWANRCVRDYAES